MLDKYELERVQGTSSCEQPGGAVNVVLESRGVVPVVEKVVANRGLTLRTNIRILVGRLVDLEQLILKFPAGEG